MKIILIILNLLLAGAVLWSGARFVQDISGKSQPAAFTVKKRVPKNQKAAAEVQSIQIRQFSVPTAGEAQVKEIVELDVFNQDRCPNAGVWGGNARVEMTLVGTFRIGNTQGAVILQKNQARSNQFMQFGGMMNNPGGGMMQRRQGIGPGGPGGFGGGFNGN